MKKSLPFLFLLCLNVATAQVKIGENPNAIDASSILELESSSKVLVITRVTTTEMNALTPLQGALVYNEDESCIFYYDGTNWNNLCAGSGGNSSWGAITGTLADQTDLVAEFNQYVDLTTLQSVAGEKTFTDRLTVNTGNTNNQVAEFLGRVKGEDGTAPEDFITKAQLDATGGGNAAWGDITGTLAAQTDLAGEFAKYVDLTTGQSVAGEKTFTEKFTVDIGNTGVQVAEFLWRVKGENGTADEDFVTKLQLDAVTVGGHTGTEGSIFFADANTQPIEDNANLVWDNTNKRLGIGINTPNSSLHIKGAISKPIAFGQTGLNDSHHTVLLDFDAPVFLPDPSTCTGRIYIIKKRPGVNITLPGGYSDSDSNFITTMIGNVLQLQSNGFNWEQIN